uniref:Ovule protein n=1 Tax=Heterorhabditis bacteriophora TaxID=37862 RepID=A0A1I7XSM9_HETBA
MDQLISGICAPISSKSFLGFPFIVTCKYLDTLYEASDAILLPIPILLFFFHFLFCSRNVSSMCHDRHLFLYYALIIWHSDTKFLSDNLFA